MRQLRSFVRAIGVLASLMLVGCGDGEDETATDGETPEATALEISGTWQSDFGSTEIIADASWDTVGEDFTASTEIVHFDNEANVLVSMGPDFTDPEKDVYSRIVWTEPERGSFYYCIVLFGRETLSEALVEEGVADASEPEIAGCGDSNFPWTQLNAP